MAWQTSVGMGGSGGSAGGGSEAGGSGSGHPQGTEYTLQGERGRIDEGAMLGHCRGHAFADAAKPQVSCDFSKQSGTDMSVTGMPGKSNELR